MVEFPNTTRRLAVPFLPRPTIKDPELSRWGNDLTLALSQMFDQLATRIEELATTAATGGLAKAPPPSRGRGFFYDGSAGDLYFDNGSWTKVASLKAADHSVVTTNFAGILTASENTTQKALDKIDDHLHDGAYISIISPVVANRFPYTTASGELTDSGYYASSFAAALHTHGYLPLTGGEMTGDITFINAEGVQGKEVGGTIRNIALVNASDEVEFGNDITDTNIKGENIYLGDKVKLASGGRLTFDQGYLYASNGTIFAGLMSFGTTRFTMNSAGWECYAAQNITFQNAVGVKSYNAAGTTAYNLIYMDSSNEINVGHSGIVMNLIGARLDTLPALANNLGLAAEESGGTERNVVKMNTSNELELGNTNNVTKLVGSSTKWGDVAGGNYGELQSDGDLIQTGTPIIQNATRVETPELRGKLWNTTKEKALTDNGAYNLLQWDSVDGASVAFMIHYEVIVKHTVTSVTQYISESGVIMVRMINKAGTVTVTATKQLNAQTNTGTGVMTVTVGTGVGTNYGRVNINADLTTGVWTSGEVRYQVLSTDTDFSGLSLF